ncbi:Hypothetical protein NTJ_04081 [Nesidiocoris tenuis]|uniref:Uncharacterized protein n=1 Tax=Nesidiocoris tenuis TaxID=355587 RepID=A0ABN7AG82_9HEMI|nr:Hypothetical protein NTJ_04081 [Nesidiocoris tenuis]
MNEYSDLCPQLNSPTRSFGMHGTTIAIGHWKGGLTVYSNSGSDLLTAQVFDSVPEVRDIHVALDSLVMLIDDWVVLNRLQDRKFIQEAVFHAETEKRLGDVTEIKELPGPISPQFVCSKILLVTSVSVWLKTVGLKIFCRADQTFVNYNVNPITDMKSNQNWVAILRPESIDLYQHNGVFVYCIRSSSFFYTGLVMSQVGFAFLESLDFDDPNAAYVNLHSREKIVIGANANSKLKVYRLALFQSTIYCLSGRAKFELSCHELNGERKFSIPVMGSKYLRPGMEFFEIVCSKFIFISPVQFCLDLLELYDKDTGDKVLSVSVQTSPYNIAQVSDSGLVLRLSSQKQNWRERLCLRGILCRSMTCKVH